MGAQPETKGALTPDPADALGWARYVIEIEMRELAKLATALTGRLGEAFERTLVVLSDCTGRIVVTGMGKSGHIARKIAATLASTGSPALFVHPAEASHGDLGMITKGDCALAFSLSGETRELNDLVAYTRRFGIPLISVTGAGGGMLAEASDVSLTLPELIEACPMGLAPTSSTTLMLALGDALAIAALQQRGFTSGHFRQLHPGGNLGKRLLQVRDLMHTGTEVPLVSCGMTVGEAVLEMTAKALGCVGVCDDGGRLVGVITDGDLRRSMGDVLLALPVEAIMNASPRFVAEQLLAIEALGEMNRAKITSLFIRDDQSGKPRGVLHIHDCLRAGLA